MQLLQLGHRGEGAGVDVPRFGGRFQLMRHLVPRVRALLRRPWGWEHPAFGADRGRHRRWALGLRRLGIETVAREEDRQHPGRRVAAAPHEPRLERVRHVLGRRVAPLGRGGGGALDDASEILRYPFAFEAIHRNALVHDLPHHLVRGLAREALPPGQQLEQHHAGRIDIGLDAALLTCDVLGCKICILALHQARLGLLLDAAAHPHHAEVRQLHVTAGADEDVRRVHVPVDDLEGGPVGPERGVGVVKTAQNLGDDEHGQLEGERLAPGAELGVDAAKVRTLHVFERDEHAALEFIDVQDRDDVRMIEAGGGAGFVEQHFFELFTVGARSFDAFDHRASHHTKGRHLVSDEQVRHAAAAQPGDDLVGADHGRQRAVRRAREAAVVVGRIDRAGRRRGRLSISSGPRHGLERTQSRKPSQRRTLDDHSLRGFAAVTGGH